MKLDDCDCTVMQIYCLNDNGYFRKRALFINVDETNIWKNTQDALNVLKGIVDVNTNIYHMKGCYYAD